MAYRFTNSDKWNDVWFLDLKPMSKMLFIYLCDNCDIAGFIEVNIKKWSSDIDTDKRTIEGALKGLERGLIYSLEMDCIYIRNFLKHQKNLPLNEKNKAHLGILKRFNLYSYKFNIQNVVEFIEGAMKGLQSPTGIGIGIGNDNSSIKVNNILDREKDFKKEVESYNTKYSIDLLKAFFIYWSEPNQQKTKMRYELEKTWDTKRRLITWYERSNKK